MLGITVNAALYAILIPIYFFFFAWNFERMSRTVVPLIPIAHRPHISACFGSNGYSRAGLFSERFLIAVITGVLYAVGWALTEVPYWFLWEWPQV